MTNNQIIRELLNKRGITTEEGIEEFLSDKPKKTYDPSLLSDAKAGVDLILSEVARGAKICVYGDYDADGITATTLMMSILSNIAVPGTLDYYIPSRFDEGYGLNMEAVKHIADKGTELIITVDCGSVSPAEVEYAKELGMKIVVTDHHTITDEKADCLLVNPKREDDEYPFKGLCGCGVAFKMAQIIQKTAGLPKSVLSELLDLVAIGTVGDVMPMLDENRTLVKFGLKVLNSGRRYGLRKLAEGAGLKLGVITSEDIGYVIAPHLNASGRMEDASEAVQLLLAPEGSREADRIVENLLAKNRERRRLQQETFDRCVGKIAEAGAAEPAPEAESAPAIKDQEPGNQEAVGSAPEASSAAEAPATADSGAGAPAAVVDDFLLLRLEGAHEGITGIVAGKIKEKYNRPTVIVTPTGEAGKSLKGTGRSIEGVNLYDVLKRHEHLFEKFGGHAGACGFTMPAEYFDELREGLLADMAELKAANPEIFVEKRPFDLELQIDDMNIELAEEIEKLAPFGSKNRKPVFCVRDADIYDVRYMGDIGQHVRFKAAQLGGEQGVTCVLFSKAKEHSDALDVDHHTRAMAGSLDAQTWQGSKRLQLMISWME